MGFHCISFTLQCPNPDPNPVGVLHKLCSIWVVCKQVHPLVDEPTLSSCIIIIEQKALEKEKEQLQRQLKKRQRQQEKQLKREAYEALERQKKMMAQETDKALKG